MSFFVAKNIIKNYANHRALDDVSIEIPEGAIYGLLGPNGAGKTSLIRIINQITGPDSGELYFKDHKLEPADMNRIGYLPEERGLYKKMKVGEQAIYLAQLKGLSYQEARIRLIRWFEKFDIMPWWNKKLEELSKGMQQKIQFIITIIHEPKLLIFDEPFSGFDPVNAELLKKEILELKDAGHTIIFSTHNMSSVEEICDNIALINRSQVVLSGNVTEVKSRFRTNNFTLRFHTGSGKLQPIPEMFSLLTEKDLAGTSEVRIHKEPGITNSALLSALAGQTEIISFTEEIPSMNDIFINTVSGTNTTQA